MWGGVQFRVGCGIEGGEYSGGVYNIYIAFADATCHNAIVIFVTP